MSGGVLEGVRVVDLTSVVVGPVATMNLGDHGADVIKVESPDGDLLRRLGGMSRCGQLSPKFLHMNRNKRSIALDLKRPRARQALERLIASADICVSNMREAAMERLGLGRDALEAAYPRLIHCRLVGFGDGGRYAARPAYDGIIQGMGGMTAIFEEADGRPRFVPMTIADHVVGLVAVQQILYQLYRRERTGKGGTLSVPMFENLAAFVMSEHMGQLTFEPKRGEPGDRRVLDPGTQPIPTKDGYICISANTDHQAHALFRAIGRPELCEDPRFATVQARYANVSQYFSLRNAALGERTTQEWLDILGAADVPAGPSHSLMSLLDDPHLSDVSLFELREHPYEGMIRNIALPGRAADLARSDYLPPPLLGEHGREILSDAGLRPEEIDAMVAARELVTPEHGLS
ncbi:CoA transferase [Sphingobium sp. V4]|uniref:CaiB/BaiF CoA transferase family protein n=1 Tax=Sphingobium sp. V4 TaxID=3038927 RepID=UPI00255820A4|nr:CoA transferase [Sphingobium sp. V4]WIW89487.1 CoA transferase [Sphingobium sp. V4]